jgi:hypothetical protein
LALGVGLFNVAQSVDNGHTGSRIAAGGYHEQINFVFKFD